MPVSYFGGKSRIGQWIYQFIPKDIKIYAEPFSGAYWVYFNLKHDFTDCEKIIYNDFNKYMTNMVACCKDHNKLLNAFDNLFKGELHTTHKPGSEEWKTFYKEIYYSYNSTNRKTKDFLDEPSFDIPDYDAAALYAFLQNSTFNGCFPNTNSGCAPFAKDKLKLQAFINKLSNVEYQKKFKNITNFHNEDFESLIKKYDSEDTYFYLDPPYAEDDGIKEKGNKRLEWYNSEGAETFGFQSHKRLADLLKKTKAKWALSYYYFKELEEWYPRDQYHWETRTFQRTSATGAVKEKQTKGEELLIMNYDPTTIECRTFNEKPKKTTKPKVKKEDEPIANIDEQEDFWD